MSQLLQNLNEKQIEAVKTTEGPVLVVAGAGSGKTKALTNRIAYLMKEKKVSPWNILAVTFTNKAANEMKERLRGLLQEQTVGQAEDFIFEDFFNPQYEPQLPMMGTFHSICVRILRKHIHLLGYENNFVIYDTADQAVLTKRLMMEMSIDPKKFAPRAVLSAISNAKNELIGWQKYQERSGYNFFTQKVGEFYERYQKSLQKNNAVDFDDIIMLTVVLFQTQPEVLKNLQDKFRYISVDEYQDTNHAQYLLVKMLAEKYRNLCVIGDSDQSIYSWRGADMRNILEFEKDYPDAKVVKLEQNYRSTQVILEASNHVIAKNQNRREKSLWTEKEGGERVKVFVAGNEKQEAVAISRTIGEIMQAYEFPDYRDFAVLYRTNAQSRVIEEVFLRFGIPYKIVGGIRFYERKEIKDVLSYLKVILNPSDSVSLLRILNVPTRSIGAKTVEVVQMFAMKHNLTFFEAMERSEEMNEELSATKIEGLKNFVAMVRKLQSVNHQFAASGVIKHLIDYSGYKRFLDDGSVEGEARLENVRELISVATKYDSLEAGMSLNIFLEEVALIADVDRLDEQENSVTMMTVHSAKGLEFPVVFICGLEEGVFPHSRSLMNQQELEEERRLMYVAMTRAKEHLFLLHAEERMLYGDYKRNAPSQFIKDIPEEFLETNYPKKPKPTLDVNRMGYRPIPHEEIDSVGIEPSYEEPTIDIHADLDEVEYSVGDRVVHGKFGEGTMTEVTGGIATVKFDNVRYGTKKLALSVAPLRPL